MADWIYIWNNSIKYEGEYKNNKIEGKGKWIWPNDDIYEVDFKNGKGEVYDIKKFKR